MRREGFVLSKRRCKKARSWKRGKGKNHAAKSRVGAQTTVRLVSLATLVPVSVPAHCMPFSESMDVIIVLASC